MADRRKGGGSTGKGAFPLGTSQGLTTMMTWIPNHVNKLKLAKTHNCFRIPTETTHPANDRGQTAAARSSAVADGGVAKGAEGDGEPSVQSAQAADRDPAEALGRAGGAAVALR